MDTSALLEFTQRGLLLALWVTLPVVLTAAGVGILVAVIQATTQLQDQTASSIFKLIGAAVVLALTAHWMGSSVYEFADEIMRAGGFNAATPKI
jgi:type III secretion protein S